MTSIFSSRAHRIAASLSVATAAHVAVDVPAHSQEQASVAQTRCIISMRYWCIATGAVNGMQQDDDKRVWSLGNSDYFPADPLEISESRACDSILEIEPRKIRDEIVERAGQSERRILIWQLDRQGDCTLEFSYALPQEGGDSGYLTTIRYGIFLGGQQLADFETSSAGSEQ